VLARKTPRTVVARDTRALFSIQRRNGWSPKTDVKFAREKRAGHGTMARRRSQASGSCGRSAMARLWPPESAMVTTQRSG